jgi:hypothetical protein
LFVRNGNIKLTKDGMIKEEDWRWGNGR